MRTEMETSKDFSELSVRRSGDGPFPVPISPVGLRATHGENPNYLQGASSIGPPYPHWSSARTRGRTVWSHFETIGRGSVITVPYWPLSHSFSDRDPSGEEEPGVDDADVVISAERRAMPPFLDRQAAWLREIPSAARVEPGAKG